MNNLLKVLKEEYIVLYADDICFTFVNYCDSITDTNDSQLDHKKIKRSNSFKYLKELTEYFLNGNTLSISE